MITLNLQFFGGRGSAGGKKMDSTYSEQTFKRTNSAFGKTTYESELFKISSYTRNTPGTSWKTSGYSLMIKGTFGPEAKFDTLREAKEFVNSDKGKTWYEEKRKK